jgi:hypothetical protein
MDGLFSPGRFFDQFAARFADFLIHHVFSPPTASLLVRVVLEISRAVLPLGAFLAVVSV